MRGLAVVVMMQTHAYDSWLKPEARRTAFFGYSRLLGGAPAPLFLFLAGLSLALWFESRSDRARPRRPLVREGVRRGLQVLVYAFLFRAGLLVTGGFARPRDFFRVDVLNCIGLSMAIVAGAGLSWSAPRARFCGCALLGAVLALATPLAWDGAWPSWIPTPLLGYVSGRVPDALFPLFPFAAFTAAGASAGVVLAQARESRREGRAVMGLALSGVAAVGAGVFLDRLPGLYPRYDFWYTSPNFLLIRVGLLLVTLGAAHAWSRLPWASWPSPLRQLGRTSLLVYWAHIEIVYGGIVAPRARGSLDVAGASVGLALLTLAMLLLSLARTRGLPGRLFRPRGPSLPAAPAPFDRARHGA